MDKMASAVYEVAQQGLVQKALKILADPNDLRKEQAEEHISFARVQLPELQVAKIKHPEKHTPSRLARLSHGFHRTKPCFLRVVALI
jgi:hypothetical protein